jgi:hypothetical protein
MWQSAYLESTGSKVKSQHQEANKYIHTYVNKYTNKYISK